jgi:hypothetical protein
VSLERRVPLGEGGVGGARHHLAARREGEEVGAAVGRVREAPDEPPLDEALDVVAQCREGHAGRSGDRGRAHRLVLTDVRHEGQLVRRDSARLELVLEDPADVLRGNGDIEEEPVVPLHEVSVADSASTQ